MNKKLTILKIIIYYILYIIQMSNFFKKISKGTTNMFSKIDKGADNMFSKAKILVLKLVQILKMLVTKSQE